MSEKITKSEVDLLSAAIDRILNTEVLEKDILDNVPRIHDLQDSNKVYCGKVSVLFVDMRESTQLPDQFDSDQLVKIYRSYIRTVVQAVRYSYGVVRDFMGDGVLAVFVDDENGKSEDKAVHAARYITTAIDKFLNPVLDKKINHRISCGIGIHTGVVSLSKVGMKGKEQDEDSENEFGIAWIGNSTNLACKQCGMVECGSIFISTSTYSALSDNTKKEVWKFVNISKGNRTLSGYISEHHYLSLDEEIEPYVPESQGQPVNILEVLEAKTNDLTEQAKKIGAKEQALDNKRKELEKKESSLSQKAQSIQTEENSLKYEKYLFHKTVIGSAHCKAAYAKAMGQSFWEDHLKKAILAGSDIGKDEHKVKQEVSYAMVGIYQALELYDRAYDFLVEQATGYAWLSLYIVQEIVRKVGYCNRLKSAIRERLSRRDLSPQYQRDFELIDNWLTNSYESHLSNWS